MSKAIVIALFSTALLGLSASAFAEETKAPARQTRGTLEMERVDIVLKRQRPLASIDVARVPLESTISQLRQPLVDRIGKATEKEPF